MRWEIPSIPWSSSVKRCGPAESIPRMRTLHLSPTRSRTERTSLVASAAAQPRSTGMPWRSASSRTTGTSVLGVVVMGVSVFSGCCSVCLTHTGVPFVPVLMVTHHVPRHKE